MQLFTGRPSSGAAVTEAELPAGTEVIMSINEEVNSKSHKLGDQIGLTVVHDVKLNGHVVIPRGTRAVGQLVPREGNGSFGKPAKCSLASATWTWTGNRCGSDNNRSLAGGTPVTIPVEWHRRPSS